MKRIAFILGLVVMTTLLVHAEAQYKPEADGTYSYTGTPVSELSVDFTTWATTDLPAPLADDMPLAESHNMGFVKWKIASRACGAKGTVNALFNNDNGDFSTGSKNNATTNKPRIYLPTTTGSVKKITVFGGFSGSSGTISIGVRYKDANHAAWTWAGSIVLPYSFAEVSIDLNTTGQTSIYLEYSQTPYAAITHLDMELSKPLYVFDTESGTYTYQGAPVDALNVDFTTWFAGYLPSSLTDDMELVEKNGLGFVKWKVKKFGEQYMLYNDDNNDFNTGPKNNATTNPPAIYFPTTVRGIKSIAIKYAASSGFWLNYTVKDKTGSKTQSVQLEASDASDPKTYVLDLNSEGASTFYFLYKMTVWPKIMSINFTLADEATGSDNVQCTKDNVQCTKVMKNGVLYLMYEGRMYDVLGRNLTNDQ